MGKSKSLIVFHAEHLLEPVIPARENGEHGTKRQHIMEMRDHIIGVMQYDIQPGVRQYHTGYTTNCEQEDKANKMKKTMLIFAFKFFTL